MPVEIQMDFAGKSYWIIGASSGIGSAVSEMLAQAGARVILTARGQRGLEALAERCEGRARVLPGNMLDIEEPRRLFNVLESEAESLDGLVYCVGFGDKMRLKQISYAAMQESMLGNCFAFVELARLLNNAKEKAQPLRVVAISSLASTEFQKYLTLYAMGKAALEASVRCLSAELGNRNVRINCIRPAFVDTPRLAGLNELTGGVEEELKKSGYQPLGLIPAKNVASLALFLLSDAATYINGACLPVNAGAQC